MKTESVSINFEDLQAVKNLLSIKSLPEKLDILKQINYFELRATQQDVRHWRTSRLTAIYYELPDWTDYIRVLDDVMIDGHIYGIIETVKDKIKSKEFEILVGDKVNDKLIELFEQEWFFKFMEHYIDSLFYPYTLIQLGNLDEHNRFSNIEIIPRENVVPQKHWIKKNAYMTSFTSADAGWDFMTDEMKNYFIFISGKITPGIIQLSTNHLGLLDKAAYHALGKKHMLIYWWRYGEIYGLPFRHGKTDIRDRARRENMELMLKNSGNNQYIMTDKEDDLTLLEARHTSSLNVYKELMDFSNNEISKAFIGSTSVTDEKSFVGSAEVGERVFEDRQKSILRKFVFLVNNQLIPRMAFYGLPVENCMFRFRYEDKINYELKLKAVEILKTMYDFDEQELSDAFGFKLTKKQFQQSVTDIEEGKISSVMPEVYKLYSKILNQKYGKDN